MLLVVTHIINRSLTIIKIILIINYVITFYSYFDVISLRSAHSIRRGILDYDDKKIGTFIVSFLLGHQLAQ